MPAPNTLDEDKKMNLDLDTLREMISSTLQEITTESAEKATAELAEDTKQDVAEAKEKRLADLSPEPPTSVAAESFQITKGRLRQIIAEELISAKKQGIL